MKAVKRKRPRSAAAQEAYARKVIRDLWAASPLGKMEAAARKLAAKKGGKG